MMRRMQFLEKAFGRLGYTIAKHPLLTILICIVIVGSCAVGVIFLKIENRIQKLYIPPDSRSLKDLAKAKKYYTKMDTRAEEIIFVPRSGDNILTRKCFLEILQVHAEATSIKNYEKYCIEDSSSKCVFINPLEIFNFDEKRMYNISETITKAYTSPGYLLRNGRPFYMNFAIMLSKAKWVNGTLRSAAALQVIYHMSDKAEEHEAVLELEGTLIKKVFDAASGFTCSKVYLSTARSVSDAIQESGTSELFLFTITFSSMILFACVLLSKFMNPLTGHGLLATLGIVAVTLGIGAGVGLSMFVGTPFINIVGVLPFLVIGIGIDDIFIILDELDRVDVAKYSVYDTVKLVMANSGATITMTTLTDLVAFAVSTSTQFPGIKYFCIYAALTITFSYLMIITFFVAFLTFDVHRIKAGRRDIVPFCRIPPAKEGSAPWTTPYQHISSKVMRVWARVLMFPAVRVFVVLASLGLVGVSVFYALKIEEKFDRSLLAKKGAYILDFLDTQNRYFSLQLQISMVTSVDIKYETNHVQAQILKLSEIATTNPYYTNMTISWMKSFKSFAQKANLSTLGSNFMPSLQTFLGVSEYAHFKEDVILSPDRSRVLASRVLCFMKSSTSSDVYFKDGMLSLRSDLKSKSALPVYPISKLFIYFEQSVLTKSEVTRNLAVAGAAVIVIIWPFLLNFIATLVVLFSFAALVFELFALMYFWNVPLNMISTVNLVMAIGFSVDYSAHVAYAYVMSTEKTPEGRAIHSLGTVGASVLMGGTSTFIGIVVLSFTSSEIFQMFFKMFLGIVVLGLVHGLCFLPVYLSILCRWAPARVESTVEDSNLPKTVNGIPNQACNQDTVPT